MDPGGKFSPFSFSLHSPFFQLFIHFSFSIFFHSLLLSFIPEATPIQQSHGSSQLTTVSSQLATVSSLSAAYSIPTAKIADLVDPVTFTSFFHKIKFLDCIIKVYIGRVVNKTVNCLPGGEIGKFLEDCAAKLVETSVVTLNTYRRAGRIYEVLLSNMEEAAPAITDFKWFTEFPSLKTRDLIWEFYQEVSKVATSPDKIPTVQDLIITKNNLLLCKFFFFTIFLLDYSFKIWYF